MQLSNVKLRFSQRVSTASKILPGIIDHPLIDLGIPESDHLSRLAWVGVVHGLAAEDDDARIAEGVATQAEQRHV